MVVDDKLLLKMINAIESNVAEFYFNDKEWGELVKLKNSLEN